MRKTLSIGLVAAVVLSMGTKVHGDDPHMKHYGTILFPPPTNENHVYSPFLCFQSEEQRELTRAYLKEKTGKEVYCDTPLPEGTVIESNFIFNKWNKRYTKKDNETYLENREDYEDLQNVIVETYNVLARAKKDGRVERVTTIERRLEIRQRR